MTLHRFMGNHDAFEFDDIGGEAASHSPTRREDRHVVGLGRHTIGSNALWSMTDPAGTMFEFFTDMDDIPDADAWTPRADWEPGEFSTWGPKQPPHAFAVPPDLDAIAKAREAEGR